PVAIDLARPDLDTAIRTAVGDRDIGLLVYNACYSVIGPYLETLTADKQKMIDVNCRGPVTLVDTFVPEMVARKRGGVILMSSMSGFQGSALVAAYAATKAFNTVLAEGLWEELAPHGVDVLGMVAGATRTPGFEQQTPTDRQRMTFPMDPEDVAREALTALGRQPLAIAGPVNKAVHFVFSRLVPRQAAVRFFARTTRKVYGE
ncbi:MAG: SDR family NAD(P)-dependent oxidoreductase, partial [Candidatus Dadabacteria bacterium]